MTSGSITRAARRRAWSRSALAMLMASALLLLPPRAEAQAVLVVLAERGTYSGDGVRHLEDLVAAYPPRQRLILCSIEDRFCDLMRDDDRVPLKLDGMSPEERRSVARDAVTNFAEGRVQGSRPPAGWMLGATPNLYSLQEAFSKLDGILARYRNETGNRRRGPDTQDNDIRVLVVATDFKLTPGDSETVRNVVVEEGCFGLEGKEAIRTTRPPANAEVTLHLVVPGGGLAPAKGFPPQAAATIARVLGNGQSGVNPFTIVQSAATCPVPPITVPATLIAAGSTCPNRLRSVGGPPPPDLACVAVKTGAKQPGPPYPSQSPPSVVTAPQTHAGLGVGVNPVGTTPGASPPGVPTTPSGAAPQNPTGQATGRQSNVVAPSQSSGPSQPTRSGPQQGAAASTAPSPLPGQPSEPRAQIEPEAFPKQLVPAPGQQPGPGALSGPVSPVGVANSDLPRAEGVVPFALAATTALRPAARSSLSTGIGMILSGASGLKATLMAFGPDYVGRPDINAPDVAVRASSPAQLDLASPPAKGRWRIFVAVAALDAACTGGLNLAGTLSIDLPGVKRTAAFRAQADTCPAGTDRILLELAEVTVL